MDNIYKILDYKSIDIRENIQILINQDISDKEKQLILEDLPKQLKEMLDVLYSLNKKVS